MRIVKMKPSNRRCAIAKKMGLRGLYIEANEVDKMDLSESEKDELYIYIDPTLYNSECHPAYFNLENLGIKKAA